MLLFIQNYINAVIVTPDSCAYLHISYSKVYVEKQNGVTNLYICL